MTLQQAGNKLVRFVVLILLAMLLASCGGGGSAVSHGNSPVVIPRLGAISYWSSANLYDQLPSGAIAVVNPSNGIFTGQTTTLASDVASYATIVSNAAARNVAMLGYVPTGYFSHGCNVATQCQTLTRIDAQVQAYFQNMPGLNGIFFDEASPKTWNCSAFIAEYQQLRDIVHLYNPQAKIAFNAAVPDICVVNSTAAGEIAVLFESDQASYQSQASAITIATAAALAKGVIPWHLIHSVSASIDLATVLSQASASKVGLFYATDKLPGQNIWNSLPTYWSQELSLMGY
jgi:hypothetical protein